MYVQVCLRSPYNFVGKTILPGPQVTTCNSTPMASLLLGQEVVHRSLTTM